MRTVEEFIKKVEEKKIKQWYFRECSFCDEPIGFVFIDNKVFFDPDCECVAYKAPLELRTYEDVANQYNKQTNKGVIKEYDEFWGFNNQ